MEAELNTLEALDEARRKNAPEDDAFYGQFAQNPSLLIKFSADRRAASTAMRDAPGHTRIRTSMRHVHRRAHAAHRR